MRKSRSLNGLPVPEGGPARASGECRCDPGVAPTSGSGIVALPPPSRRTFASDVPDTHTCRVSLPNYRWSLIARRPKPGYPNTLKTLGDYLKVRRLDLGLTQKVAAAKLAVGPDTVRNWESGRTSIEDRLVPGLIAFLGYNPLPEAHSFGKAIERERITRGWSRKNLAKRAGVDEATVKRVEEDRRVSRRSYGAVHQALRR